MFLGALCLIAAAVLAATATGSVVWRSVLTVVAVIMSIALTLGRLGVFG
jgi:hypothetical protein